MVETSVFTGNLNLTQPLTELEFYSKSSDIIHIGKTVLQNSQSFVRRPTPTIFNLTTFLNGNSSDSESLRKFITFDLNNNTQSSKFSKISHERPVSAFYTYNPQDDTVIMEWGTIDPKDKEARLHGYLRQHVDYMSRIKSGMKLISGHLSKISGTNEYIALLDNLTHEHPGTIPNDQIKKTVNILHKNYIIPITGDGFVQAPFL